ncbi:hypothetical protein PIB30_008377 [Stylosanthes scabra]|uniref:Uncharacterized protein n=1 Tax=Stylosanthes scabra TaxID=79078 RepID=A0ABU6U5V6_9FABA|nr:hypothetical protein [Stylosanthes scabra]
MALNDHHVPPVDAVCRIFALLSVTGSSPCFGRSTSGTFVIHVLVLEHGRFGGWSMTFDRSEPYWEFLFFLSLSISATIRPVAPRPPCPAGSPSSSVSSSSSGSFHRDRERSPRTPLPPPAPMHVPRPVHHVLRTPMMDARRYRSLFPRRRVAPPTPPSPLTPLSSDDKPSDYGGDIDANEIGDPGEPYAISDSSLSSRDVSSAGASCGSERESASLSSGPSDHFSSDSSSGSGSVGYGSVTSGSASDASSDDVLVYRHFAETFPPP